MNCRACKSPLSPGTKFCPACGTPVAHTARPFSVSQEIRERAANFSGRRWVLDEVVNWIDEGKERYFLITGEPGSGKTALAAWLAGLGDAAADDDALGRVVGSWSALHFCVADDRRGSLNPGRFAQSLARQLTDRFEGYAEALLGRDATFNITQVVKENRGKVVGAHIDTLIINGSNFEDIYNRTVREPLEELAFRPGGLRALILVDALDEAYTFGSTNITTLLTGSNDLPEGVRFLLTCRSNTPIPKAFKSVRRLNLADARHKKDNDDDIRVYVAARLAELGLGARSERLADDLVARADGNFLYVEFVLDEVKEGKRSLDDTRSLPRGLYGMYTGYLDRVMSAAAPDYRNVAWHERYQPLLGCLSVALPAAPRDNLHRWMHVQAAHTNNFLNDVIQLTRRKEAYGGAYTLYHRSMADFLAKPEYGEEGDITLNEYHTPPGEQHGRIVRYYLERFAGDWQGCDEYGLNQLVNHMQAWRTLTAEPGEKKRGAQQMLSVVLDESFRRAQREKLGDIRATLEDLRTALGVALAEDEPVKALACVGVYRSTVSDSCFIEDALEAVARGDFKRALRLASHYGTTASVHGTWAKALYLYLAWEAAEAGDVDSAVAAAATAEELPAGQSLGLCQALLARAARALASQPAAGGGSAFDWLRVIARDVDDPQWLFDTYDIAKPLAPEKMKRALDGLRMVESRMEQTAARMAAEWDPETSAQLAHNFFNAEAAADEASALARALTELAAEEAGRERIDKILLPVLSNPYPEYRDLALVALGATILGVPDRAFVRSQLQRIFKATLNSEGVTFTYDLPSVLLAEAESRQMSDAGLSDYVARAYDFEDLWGTKLRAHSARAAALFWQGCEDEARNALAAARRLDVGFSGFMVVHLLSLINRGAEFGQQGDDSLLEEARRRAENVSDYQFRERRIQLADTYASWTSQDAAELVPPRVREMVSRMTDTDVSMAFYDFVSARWAGARREELRLLVPSVLGHGTTLDAVLGRLFGLCVKRLADGELAEAIRICAAHLTTAHP